MDVDACPLVSFHHKVVRMEITLTRKEWKRVSTQASIFSSDLKKFLTLSRAGNEVTITLTTPYADWVNALTHNDWKQPSLFDTVPTTKELP